MIFQLNLKVEIVERNGKMTRFFKSKAPLVLTVVGLFWSFLTLRHRVAGVKIIIITSRELLETLGLLTSE